MSKVHKNHGKKLLSILNEQITSLLSYEDHTPQIEIDIVKDNMRKLYEFIDSINNSVAVTSNISHKNIEDIDKEINDLLDNAQSQFQKEDEQIEQQIKEQEVALEEQSIEDIIEPEIPNEEEIIKVHKEIDTALITNDSTEEIAKEIIEEVSKIVDEVFLEEQAQEEDNTEVTNFAEASEVKKEEIKEEEVIEKIIETPTEKPKKEDELTSFAEATEVKKEVEPEIKVKAEIILDTIETSIEKVEKPEASPFAKAAEIETEVTPFAEALEVKEKTIHVLDVAPEEELEDDDDNVEKDVLLAKSLKLKAIKSLKTGIGINDKFMIINDLFEGRAKEFNASIKKLDSQEDMQQALYLLGDMKDENLWESDDRVFKIFKTYIQRRYI